MLEKAQNIFLTPYNLATVCFTKCSIWSSLLPFHYWNSWPDFH